MRTVNGLGSLTFSTAVGATGITDGNQYLRIDLTTGAVEQLDYEHHEIHGGSHYFIEDYVTKDNTETIDFGLRTPDTSKWTHLVWEIQSNGTLDFDIYEGCTITFDGTPVTPRNNNRNFADNSSLTIHEDPTVVLGDRLGGASVGSANNPNRGIPGGGDRTKEVILRQGTDYLFRFTSGLNDNVISYLAEWYEHTNKTPQTMVDK